VIKSNFLSEYFFTFSLVIFQQRAGLLFSALHLWAKCLSVCQTREFWKKN